MPLLDSQLRVWFGGNIGGPIVLYYCKTDLTRHVTGPVDRMLRGAECNVLCQKFVSILQVQPSSAIS